MDDIVQESIIRTPNLSVWHVFPEIFKRDNYCQVCAIRNKYE